MQAANVQPITQTVIVGLDIGNGWVKLVSNVGDPIVFQSLAAPVSAMGDGFMGTSARSPIVIDGEAWDAGFFPNETDHVTVMGKGAAFHQAHHALFLEAIHRLGVDQIDFLAVGLPSDQIGDQDNRKKLQAKFSGVHQARGKEIYVDQVGVYEQPRGTARAFLDDNAGRFGNQTFLVVDPGYGSTDVTRVRVAVGHDKSVRVRSDMSFSVWQAVSKVCDIAAETIQATDHMMTPSEISQAMFGDGRVVLAGEPFDVRPYVAGAANGVGNRLIAAIKSRLVSFDGVDIILLTGGGAKIFEPQFAEAFGRRVKVMKDSATANARGFLLLAQGHAKKQ